MASDVLKWVLIGGAAYLIYTEFFSTPAAAAPPAGGTGSGSGGSGTPPPPSTPNYVYTPPTTVQQLQNAAGAQVTQLDADQWGYYWQQIGKPAIDGAVFGQIFFPNGRPADATQNPEMTAAQFMAAIATKGLSGLATGRATPVFLPVILNPNGPAAQSRYRRRAA